MENEQSIRILYTNYRGETAIRQVIPKRLWFGNNEWHTEPQWLLDAYDLEKEAERTFAVLDIKSWFRE